MNQPLYRLTKAILSGAVIVAVSKFAKRNNTLASIVHSLPLMSLVAFIWLFAKTHDKALAAGIVVTVLLYALTLRLLKTAGVQL